MGFNIAGMVINSNYDQDINKVEKDLRIGLEVVKEITFEEASSNWKDDNMFYLYFGKHGTMIFFAHEAAIDRGLSQKHESMSYAYSATAMAFYISYSDIATNSYREIMESEGGRTMNEGTPLPLETDHPTADGLTFALMDKIMEENWHGIAMDEKCYLCKPGKYDDKKNRLSHNTSDNQDKFTGLKIKVATPEPLKQSNNKIENSKNISPMKKWWEFWK